MNREFTEKFAMASSATSIYKKGSFIIACFCLQFLFSPCSSSIGIYYRRPYLFIGGEPLGINQITECWEHDLKNGFCEDFDLEDYTHVIIFSSSYISIRESFSFPKNNIVFGIVSPKWVIGRYDGDKVNVTFPGYDQRVNKLEMAPEGVDGAPGVPGGPGGMFFGVGEEFLNGRGLTIVSQGGKGGPGQDGGDGREGRDGKNATILLDNSRLDEVKCTTLLKEDSKTIDGFHTELGIAKNNSEYHFFNVRIDGIGGESGSEAGNGGQGGRGGLPGSVLLLDLGKSPSGVATKRLRGVNGEDGKGGEGRNGGLNGNRIHSRCIYQKSDAFNPPEINTRWLVDYVDQTGRASHGNNGQHGGNTRGIELAKPSGVSLEPTSIIDRIKSFINGDVGVGFGPSGQEKLSMMLEKLDGKEVAGN